MIAWVNRLEEERPQSYEDLRDTYVYLRSVRRLVERADQGEMGHLVWGIKEKIKRVFRREGFGEKALLKEVVGQLIDVGLGPEVGYRDKRMLLDMIRLGKDETDEEIIGKGYLMNGARKTRALNWQYRLEVAITEAVDNDWYPMFGTYTVDPKRLPPGCLTRDDLWRKTEAWDRFVKKFKTEVADACGLGRRPAKWPSGESFFKYFAVIEHGKSGDHPHIHVIWLCRNISTVWKQDPNTNSPGNLEVDIRSASSLWEHGIQRKTMALFISGSWFKNNWVVPRKSAELPGKVGTAGAIAGYISKYLTKSETKSWSHRVKCTRNLGIQTLVQNLANIPAQQIGLILSLACRPNSYSVSMKMQSHSAAPLSLVREKSKKELYKRLYSTTSTRAARLLCQAWTMARSEFFTTYIANVKAGHKPWQMMPMQRFNFYTQMLPAVPKTVHCKQRVKDAIQWLCYNEAVRNRSVPYVLLKGG